MNTNKYFVLIVFILTLVGAGCNLTPHQPKTFSVEIKDMKFVPDIITIGKGDTIIWINKDMVAHNVTEESANTWSSGPIAAEGSWKMAVNNKAGYFCSIHTVMKGKIKLK